MKRRFWEIDFLRGLAIIMMVVFHFLWDLDYFFDFDFRMSQGFWNIFRITTASLFLLLVGVSVALSTRTKSNALKILAGRAFYVLFFALLITLSTKILFPSKYIFFGILHLISFSILASYLFLSFRYFNLFFASLLIALGIFLKNYNFDFSYLTFLGFIPSDLQSLDIYPIIPWFSLVLVGIAFANIFYTKSEEPEEKIKLPDLSQKRLIKEICFLGRHSLAIYLIHQIILFPLVYIISYFYK